MSNHVPEQTDVLRAAVATWGDRAQIDQACEECAELIQAVSHYRRGRAGIEHVAEEAADVWIMCIQMAEVFGRESVERARSAFKPLAADFPADGVTGMCGALVSELMKYRSGASVPLTVCCAIGRALNAVWSLVAAMRCEPEFWRQYARKLDRLRERLKDAAGSGAAAGGA